MARSITVTCHDCGQEFQADPITDVDEFNSLECWHCDSLIYVEAGRVASAIDDRHAYNSRGEIVGTIGGMCEDAPCCGCCP